MNSKFQTCTQKILNVIGILSRHERKEVSSERVIWEIGHVQQTKATSFEKQHILDINFVCQQQGVISNGSLRLKNIDRYIPHWIRMRMSFVVEVGLSKV